MDYTRPTVIVLGLAIAAAVGLFIPTTQRRVLSYGTDAYNYHYPLYGTHQRSQTVTVHGRLQGVGALLVDLQHSKHVSPVTVTVSDTAGHQLATGQIPANAIHDDMFAWVEWPQPTVMPETITVTFSAPEATRQTALGLRFSQDNKNELALSVAERVPLWRFLYTYVQNSPNKYLIGLALLTAVILSAIVASLYAPVLPRLSPRLLVISTVGVVLLISLAVRLQTIPKIKGVSGGDPYNYLFITKNITRLQNPFENTKRLPGYPLLLAPGYLIPSVDDIRSMELISVVSGLIVIGLTAFLSYRLGLPPVVQIAAPLLLALQKDFFGTSLRPEPYTFYTVLVLGALCLFFSITKPWVQYAFGAVLGYAAMTRQEGFVLAFVLGLATLPQWRQLTWRGYVRMGIPLLLLTSPFFIHNTVTFGNPFFTPYFEGERLQIVHSWPSFQDNLTSSLDILSSIWKTSWDQLVHLEGVGLQLSVVAVLTVVWFWLYYRGTLAPARSLNLIILSSILGISGVALALYSSALFSSTMVLIASGMMLSSVIPFLLATRTRGVVVVAVLISQALIALWFHPFAKHFQQDYPLLMLMLATALFFSAPATASWLVATKTFTQSTAVLFPFILIALLLWSKLPVQLDRHNENTALDSVVYRATKQVRQLPGPYGFTGGYLPARVYFDDQASYFGGEDTASVEEQQQWLQDNHIRTLVVVNNTPFFKKPDPNWQVLGHYKQAGRNDFIFESFVYHLP